jgi:hypothetical protein
MSFFPFLFLLAVFSFVFTIHFVTCSCALFPSLLEFTVTKQPFYWQVSLSSFYLPYIHTTMQLDIVLKMGAAHYIPGGHNLES